MHHAVMHLKYIILWLHCNRLGNMLVKCTCACTMSCQSDCLSKSQEYIYIYIYIYIKHETTNELSDAHQTAQFFASKPCYFSCLLRGRKRPVHVTSGILVHNSSLSLIYELLILYYCRRSVAHKTLIFTLPLEAVKESIPSVY